MSKESSFEMRPNDRPNRFQVHAVNRTSNQREIETHDDDTFNEEEITLRDNRRSSR